MLEELCVRCVGRELRACGSSERRFGSLATSKYSVYQLTYFLPRERCIQLWSPSCCKEFDSEKGAVYITQLGIDHARAFGESWIGSSITDHAAMPFEKPEARFWS